jgi:telomerase Cajal body protein 1
MFSHWTLTPHPFSPQIRASYPIIDHRERFIAPHAMAFNSDATKSVPLVSVTISVSPMLTHLYACRLYCGFQDAIEVFDVNAPGEGLRWRLTPSKKTKSGQKGASRSRFRIIETRTLTAKTFPGIISALAFNPDQSGVFAAGSYARSISLYSESTGEKQLLSLKGLEGSGVTQVSTTHQKHLPELTWRPR